MEGFEESVVELYYALFTPVVELQVVGFQAKGFLELLGYLRSEQFPVPVAPAIDGLFDIAYQEPLAPLRQAVFDELLE